MESKNNVKVRVWLGTLNNPSMSGHEFLETFFTLSKARFVTGQLERGVEGTLHIQYYVNFREPVRLSHLKKVCKLSHFEPVRVDNGAS